MRKKIVLLLILPISLLISTVFNPFVCAAEERRVLSRNYVGLGVHVYVPHQCYSGENISVRVRVEALEDVKNASATVFIWGSKSEGDSPWGASYTVLDVADFPTGTVKQETYNVTMPSDIDPGLTYGILALDWSIYRSAIWEDQWDKASFRATYVLNRDHEDLQATYQSTVNDLQITRALMFVFLTGTIVSGGSAVYLAKRKT